MSWDTIESDPAVFSQLLEAFGCKGLEVQELISLDDESLRAQEMFGLILLFKYVGPGDAGASGAARGPPASSAEDFPGVWFAKQVISNACGTQALLHVVMNLGLDSESAAFGGGGVGVRLPDGVECGSTLQGLREFSSSLPPDARGEVLQSMDAIREAHNSFARAEPFLTEKSHDDEDGEAFHFAAYVPVAGRVLELDGLKRGPIDHGRVSDSDLGWLDTARTALQSRFEAYGPGELRFTLLAVVRDERQTAEDGIQKTTERWAQLETIRVGGRGVLGRSGSFSGSIDSWQPAETDEGRRAQQAALLRERAEYERQLENAKERRREWAKENVRRQHNWIPFIIEALSIAQEKGVLDDMRKAGQDRATEARKAAQERKK